MRQLLLDRTLGYVFLQQDSALVRVDGCGYAIPSGLIGRKWLFDDRLPPCNAAFQIVLKRRAHMLPMASLKVQTSVNLCLESLPDHPIFSSEYSSQAL